MVTRIALLGSTGSIGVNTLRVVDEHPGAFAVVALAARSNTQRLAEQVERYRPRLVALSDVSRAERLQPSTRHVGARLVAGPDGLLAAATVSEADVVVIGTTGVESLEPMLAAIRAGKRIALANKEPIVMAGEPLMALIRERQATVIPVDSEHNALFRCLSGSVRRAVERLYVTGSGGPLHTVAAAQFAALTPTAVLAHPKWKMGPKITVDSATLMNKGLEVIEARWLFEMELSRIRVLIHPEAAVHAMVEWVDGSVTALLSACDMRIPIQYALTYPDVQGGTLPRLRWDALTCWSFVPPDLEKFPCLRLALEAAAQAGTMPAVLNAANEEAVAAFLEERVRFVDIPVMIEQVMRRHTPQPHPSFADVLAADRWARQEAHEQIITKHQIPITK